MIDLHCHLLPGIDDGPETMEQSLAMAGMAVDNGTTHAVLTPHIIPGRYDNNLQSIAAACDEFRGEVSRLNIPLDIAFAAEVRLDPVIIDMIEAGTVPFLGNDAGYKLLLLEFPHDTVPMGSMELVDWLLKRFIRPVIAHPERNQAILDKPDILKPVIEAGCLLQITAGSLTGVFGKRPEKLARKFLRDGSVSLIASDAHNVHKRRPGLEQGRLVAGTILGEEESWMLVRDRPAAYTRGMFSS